jgi:hypothetical protein
MDSVGIANILGGILQSDTGQSEVLSLRDGHAESFMTAIQCVSSSILCPSHPTSQLWMLDLGQGIISHFRRKFFPLPRSSAVGEAFRGLRQAPLLSLHYGCDRSRKGASIFGRVRRHISSYLQRKKGCIETPSGIQECPTSRGKSKSISPLFNLEMMANPFVLA